MGVIRGRAGGAAASPLATMAVAEALAAVAVEPGARSTDAILRHALLAEAGALGRPLFALFSHPAGAPPAHSARSARIHVLTFHRKC